MPIAVRAAALDAPRASRLTPCCFGVRRASMYISPEGQPFSNLSAAQQHAVRNGGSGAAPAVAARAPASAPTQKPAQQTSAAHASNEERAGAESSHARPAVPERTDAGGAQAESAPAKSATERESGSDRDRRAQERR